jgi:large subunit ribosomal protein L31e
MERTYTIPLRKSFLKAPTYLRTNRAVRAVRAYLSRHMKSANVKLGEELNKALWERGDSKPPHHVTVLAKKEDDVVYAELVGKEFVKKDFSEKADEKADEKRAKTEEKSTQKRGKDAKESQAEKGAEERAEDADPAEIIGKAATAKAKAEGKIKEAKQ